MPLTRASPRRYYFAEYTCLRHTVRMLYAAMFYGAISLWRAITLSTAAVTLSRDDIVFDALLLLRL